MRRLAGIIICLVVVIGGLVTGPAFAQQSGQQRAANLRAQLVEMQARQTELQMHMQQLADDSSRKTLSALLLALGAPTRKTCVRNDVANWSSKRKA